MSETVNHRVVPPGGTVGILGGGQLGRMLAIAARRMGYRVRVLDPAPDCPTSHCADEQVVAAYDDVDALRRFAQGCDVVTFEFENVPAESLEAIAAVAQVHPSPRVLHVCRHRLREKAFLENEAKAPVGRWRGCTSAAEAEAAVRVLDGPCILKTAEFGYDGKGQVRLERAEDAVKAWQLLRTTEAICEAVVPFELEVSVIVARNAAGECRTFPIAENRHAHHILDVTLVPARLSAAAAADASAIAHRVAEAFGLIGVLAVEMFVVREGSEQRIYVNELAPRPHNSGHFSFDACVTSQFEQQLRAICSLPLGDPSLMTPAAAMTNLLGDLWYVDDSDRTVEPTWAAALTDSNVKLHLYGKQEPRRARKMGHLTAAAADVDAATDAVLAARARLSRQP